MYHQYFGLRESPFSISVNPRYLYMSPRHRDALAHLLYGVGSGGGFILLTGEVGTGKTTINRALLEQLPDNTDLAIVLNPALSAVELLASVCDEFDIDYPRGSESLKLLTDALHRFLLDNHAAGRQSVLMIDEAQHLDFDVLEQIRLLTNLETDDEKLLRIILIGQPELTEKLARPELRQLNQRITARYDLQPLNGAETAAYIRHRLQVAGFNNKTALFSPSVVREIHRRSRGIPRLINLLCDRILLGAYGRQQRRISRALVRSAAVEVFGSEERRQWGVRLLVVGLVAVVSVLLLSLGLTGTWRGLWSENAAVLETNTAAPAAVADARAVTALADGSVAANPESTDLGSTRMPASPSLSALTQPESWLLPERYAASWLWYLHSDAPEVVGLCNGATSEVLRCESRTSVIWQPLMQLKRPVLLSMETDNGFTAATVVIAFQQSDAWVMTRSGVERVPLVALARHWRGEYHFFWAAPPGWQGPLIVGDQSPLVAMVAQRFAELDAQPTALTGDLFTQALESRVKLFQSATELAEDGVVDVLTLLRLDDVQGRAPLSSALRERAGSLIVSRKP